jgi:hypothetical protein
MIGIEHEGAVHTEPGRVLRDVARYTRPVDRGRQICRYTKLEVYGEPERIVTESGRARKQRPSGT